MGLAPLYLYSVISLSFPIWRVVSFGCVIVYNPLLSLLSVNFIRVSAPVVLISPTVASITLLLVFVKLNNA